MTLLKTVSWHVDLREDDQYKGRVQYYQNQTQLYHTVRITDLRASDSQTYKFRFITDDPDGIYSIGSGVSLSVTDLTIEVLNSEQEDKRLTCSSTCTLTNPTYIWYRNEQPVPEQNGDDLYLWDPTVDAGSYSCAVKEHEEIRSAAVCGFEGLQVKVEGAAAAPAEEQTVTLTCSSMCSQSYSTYTWYRNIQPVSEQNRSVETLETGQNYSITSISSQHSGLYYCTALNQLGQHSSAPARLDVFYNTAAIYAASGVIIVLLLLFIAVILWMRKRSAQSRSRSEGNTGEPLSAPVYETVSDLAMTSGPRGAAPSDDQDEVQYSTVQFKNPRTKKVPLSSTANQKNAVNAEEEVLYSTVVKANTGAPRNEENPIYSTVHKFT
ncbi:low affinity immunoglobulin gamma Fc region receptor II-like [Astyanax mexicanus]|uniref:low affinity immunoglobulin gamma Fc region receptor II-like n=1 Tax=Astyanax mexicanus TaxID=7994 RepID=UPI0020CAE703|nr:low affinity immunoglobulin gamma Fc region receptor II-like [Astyanax mexicanus]